MTKITSYLSFVYHFRKEKLSTDLSLHNWDTKFSNRLKRIVLSVAHKFWYTQEKVVSTVPAVWKRSSCYQRGCVVWGWRRQTAVHSTPSLYSTWFASQLGANSNETAFTLSPLHSQLESIMFNILSYLLKILLLFR